MDTYIPSHVTRQPDRAEVEWLKLRSEKENLGYTYGQDNGIESIKTTVKL